MKEAIRNLEIMREATNYNRWIFDKIKPYLGRRILEIGCGVGNMTELLLKDGEIELVVGIDISLECLDIINSKLVGYKQFQGILCDVSSKDLFKLKKYNFDTILFINALEHIEDDLDVLKSVSQLSTTTTLILWVPALKKLYGSIDKAVGHFRRYEKKNLELKLMASGWKILKGSYVNLLGTVVWLLHGKLLKKSIHPPRQISFLDKFIFLEALLEKTINLPFGLSLLYIAQKN